MISCRVFLRQSHFTSGARKRLVRDIPPLREKIVHPLKNIFPWKTKQQFVEHLSSNIIYNKDGLIAINKPFAVPLVKHDSNDTKLSESLFSLEEALNPLAELLKVDQLIPVKTVERFSSGICLLATNDMVVKKVRKGYAVNTSVKIPTFTFWAITLGEPKPAKGSETVGLSTFSHEDITGKTLVIEQEFSRRKVKDGLVTPFRVTYETLATGTGSCHLVALNVYSFKHHFVRLYMAHRLSPILGDHIYGNRVQEFFGKRLRISPLQADRLASFQRIPADILKSLKIDDAGLVPNCLHLRQITLAKFINKDTNLVITAEPLSHFQFICNKLALQLPSS